MKGMFAVQKDVVVAAQAQSQTKRQNHEQYRRSAILQLWQHISHRRGAERRHVQRVHMSWTMISAVGKIAMAKKISIYRKMKQQKSIGEALEEADEKHSIIEIAKEKFTDEGK